MRLIRCVNHVYSCEIIRVEVFPASPRRSLGRRRLFNLSHFNWHMRDEHIGAKESEEHVHLPP